MRVRFIARDGNHWIEDVPDGIMEALPHHPGLWGGKKINGWMRVDPQDISIHYDFETGFIDEFELSIDELKRIKDALTFCRRMENIDDTKVAVLHALYASALLSSHPHSEEARQDCGKMCRKALRMMGEE